MFSPVNHLFEKVFSEWVCELQYEHLFGPDDPVFPMNRVGHNSNAEYEVLGIGRTHWKNANAIRRIFKASFALVGLDYFNPHSFRKTLVRLGERICQTPEEFKAWSQNLGHEQVLTTFTSYGRVSDRRQFEILSTMNKQSNSEHGEIDSATIQRVLCHLQNRV